MMFGVVDEKISNRSPYQIRQRRVHAIPPATYTFFCCCYQKNGSVVVQAIALLLRSLRLLQRLPT